MAKKQDAMELPPFKLQKLQIKLIGETPLICHNWSKKAKQEMLDKQMKKAKKGREAKNPAQQFRESLYPLPDGDGYGFPAVAFKAAAVRAANDANIKMTDARRSFHVKGEYVRIQGEPQSREDMVRLSSGTADIRYRAEFPEWECELEIEYNATVMSAEQILNLFEIAGFGVGIGDWRPEKNGQFGRFKLAK